MSDRGKKLNWQQACELLGCKKSHFYNLVNSGRLTAYRDECSKRGLWLWEADCLALVKPVNGQVSAVKLDSYEKQLY